MGNLYVIRHGQTTCNADGIIQGPRIDSELSEAGHAQADALGAAFQESELDAVYVSPLHRARQTARHLLDARPGRIDARIVPEMYEVDYGHLCGRTVDESRDTIIDVLDAWQMGRPDEPFPGGESALLAQLRVRATAARLRAEALERDLALIAHGRINRILVATLLGRSLSELESLPQDNANITHLDIGESVELRRVNDTAHLDELDPAFS